MPAIAAAGIFAHRGILAIRIPPCAPDCDLPGKFGREPGSDGTHHHFVAPRRMRKRIQRTEPNGPVVYDCDLLVNFSAAIDYNADPLKMVERLPASIDRDRPVILRRAGDAPEFHAFQDFPPKQVAITSNTLRGNKSRENDDRTAGLFDVGAKYSVEILLTE